MKRIYTPEDLKPVPLQVNLKSHIVRDLKTMELNTKIPVDDLVTKAVQFFIATHNDYLGKYKEKV